MKTLTKITDVITKIFTKCACVYLIVIFIACLLQVFSRYVLNASIGWTEEGARYAYAGLGMLGTPVALRKGLHITINILETKLKGKALMIQKIIIDICVFAASGVIFVYGIKFIAKSSGFYSSVMRLPMWVVYYVIPLCGITSMWIIVVDCLETVYAYKNGKEGENCLR